MYKLGKQDGEQERSVENKVSLTIGKKTFIYVHYEKIENTDLTIRVIID